MNKMKKGCIIVFLCYWLLAGGFYWIAGDQIRVRNNLTDLWTPAVNTGELLPNIAVEQRFEAETDTITGMTLYLSTFARTNTCTVVLTLTDEAGALLAQTEFSAAALQDNAFHQVNFNAPVPVSQGSIVQLTLQSPDSAPGNAISAWYGTAVDAGKVQVEPNIPQGQLVRIGGGEQAGRLIYQLQGQELLLFGQYYWYLVTALGLALLAYLILLCRAAQMGRTTVMLRLMSAFQRYGYLMRQLIARDFKTKYKRSVLGVFWSFLNPLLTMLMQYIVFSTLFKSGIPNFALYLLTGIVCFNFFNEAATMSLSSIVGNATLITKVYVPKYIYPLSRVFSSTINLLLSLIPLLAVILVTRTPITPAILLLPFGILCLMCLAIGMAFFLSAAMVFFRDTQFLWGVLSMLWMYATPIFYPESILPARLLWLFKCNPLYHIIRFIRTVLMDGISPEPKAYLLCMVTALVPLVLGAIVFKRNQDKFILNL